MAESAVLKLGDERIPFVDTDQLMGWLEQEQRAWNWLRKYTISQASWQWIHNRHMALQTSLRSKISADHDLARLMPIVEESFREDLVYSGGAMGKQFFAIAGAEGNEAAAAAFAIYREQASLSEVRTLAGLRAVMSVAFPAVAPIDAILKDLSTERSNLRRTLTELRHRAEENERDRARSVRISHRSAARRFLRFMNNLERRDQDNAQTQVTALESFDAATKAAVERFDATEAAYREKIGLMAPVEYWKSKAKKHKTARSWMLAATVGYFISTLSALGILFYKAAFYLIHQKLENDAALFVAGAGLATLSGVLLWAGRLITRLYLSEHHLAHDAEERAVMTETYLALSAEKAATDTERSIILAALFRNTSDGVVRDDAAPDVSLGGLIARLAGGKN